MCCEFCDLLSSTNLVPAVCVWFACIQPNEQLELHEAQHMIIMLNSSVASYMTNELVHVAHYASVGGAPEAYGKSVHIP